MILLMTMVGCVGPQLYYQQLVVLNPGMSEQQTMEVLALPPLWKHDTIVESQKYRFLQYNMNNGVSSSLYLLELKNNELQYWGYIDEFRKHPDKDLQTALDNVINNVLYINIHPPKPKKNKH